MDSGGDPAIAWRLYLDIGNFAVKYGLRRDGAWVGTGTRQHAFGQDDGGLELPAEVQPQALAEAIVAASWEAKLAGETCEAVVVCCTATGADPFIQAVAQGFWAPVRTLKRELQADLRVGYRDATEMGADRLANAVAARDLYGAPVVVIDCGTCLTSEIIDDEGVLIGGNIGAGFPLLAEGLRSVSERLEQALDTVLPEEPPNLIGHSTAEAVNFGLVLQLAGTADRFVLEACEALARDTVPVVVTGGDGEVCAGFMAEQCHFDPLLTLEGLRLIDGTA